MEFLYCFANASLTQRILDYLLRQLKSHVDSVTVIFLNDLWVAYIKLKSTLEPDRVDDCWSFFDENGMPYRLTPSLSRALQALETGGEPTQVMNRYHVAIVSHGRPNPDEVSCFQQQFVAGLGYCPPALV